MNKWKGTFNIEIGDETFTLRPSFDAMVEFEDKCGVTADVAYEQINKGQVSFKITAAAIWAGMMGEQLAKGGDVPSFRVIGQKLRNDCMIKHAQNASRFLLFAMTPEKDLAQADEIYENLEEDKKKVKEQESSNATGGDSSDT